MLKQRSQNDVRITLISRCRRCQPIFNQISTSKRRRRPAGRFMTRDDTRTKMAGQDRGKGTRVSEARNPV